MTYYKIFDGRNQLMLVTPKWENAIDFVNEKSDSKLDFKENQPPGKQGGQRLFFGLRFLKVDL